MAKYIAGQQTKLQSLLSDKAAKSKSSRKQAKNNIWYLWFIFGVSPKGLNSSSPVYSFIQGRDLVARPKNINRKYLIAHK